MIKKVQIEDLDIGIFIHDFNCDWNGGNIYIEQSVIKSKDTIDILKSWGIKEVFIDTERGRDVDSSKKRISAQPIGQGIIRERTLVRPQVPLKKELHTAETITHDALDMMQQMHTAALEGKPPDVDQAYDLATRMQASIHRNRDALQLLTRIRDKDEYTLHHSFSVSALVLEMCQYYQLSEQLALDLSVGALFHDIGKTIVPQHILNKPAKLTDDEFREMQRHVEHSVDILSKAKGLPLECYEIALHHHERYDGSGYPHGLEREGISFGSQMTSICDVFDAITSERCYKPGMDTVIGLRKIYEGAGDIFNKEMAHDFVRCVGVYPVGSCVKLADGTSGVVVGSTEDVMRPVVQVVYDEKEGKRIKPLRVDLTESDNSIVGYGDPSVLGLTTAQLLRKFLS